MIKKGDLKFGNNTFSRIGSYFKVELLITRTLLPRLRRITVVVVICFGSKLSFMDIFAVKLTSEQSDLSLTQAGGCADFLLRKDGTKLFIVVAC